MDEEAAAQIDAFTQKIEEDIMTAKEKFTLVSPYFLNIYYSKQFTEVKVSMPV